MKILFTDLDGTLLNDSVRVSNYTKEILTKFTSEGNLLVPTSGRPLLSIQEVIENSGLSPFVSYIVAYNGALIWNNKENCEVHTWCLDKEIAARVQKISEDAGIHFQTYYDEHIITHREDEEINTYRTKIHLPVTYTPDPTGILGGDPYKALFISLDNHEALCKLRDEIRNQVSTPVNLVFSNSMYLECFNVDAGKGNAVKKLCQFTGVDISDTYGAGDAENDISMLEATGCGIAMLNATEAVKAISDVITDYTNDRDGLAKFIEKNILI